MDELTLVRDLGLETPPPEPGRLAPARARLLAEARPRRLTRRLVLAAGSAGLVTAAAAAAVLISATPTPTPAPTKIPNPTTFMYAAADAVLTQPDVIPRPGQFVYVKTTLAGGGQNEFWYSIDGKHDGLGDYPDGRRKIDGCPHPKPQQGEDLGSGCQPDPHYLPDMPTTADKMMTWLRARNPNDREVTITNGIAKDISYMSETYWLRNDQRAALYRAMAQTPGLRLVPGQKTPDGHTGIGLTWDYADGVIMWIFDPATHRLLGAPGTTSHQALVDKAGERP